jgi:hypothetical protein
MNIIKSTLALFAIASLVGCNTTDKKTGASTNDTTNKIEHISKQEIAQAAAADTANATTIQWMDSLPLYLGKLTQNKEIEVTFRFKNTGDKNLVIENVSASCGCTIPETPKEPFAPGQEGIIKAKFNGSGSGAITKHVTVIANTKPSKNHELTFTGEVVESK